MTWPPSRWQTGDCGTYAIALMQADPSLRFGAILARDAHVSDGRALHYFAHDDTRAYDSRGAHPLPYVTVWDSAFRDYFTPEAAEAMGFQCMTDLDPETFGSLTEDEATDLAAARRHIKRHQILDAA